MRKRAPGFNPVTFRLRLCAVLFCLLAVAGELRAQPGTLLFDIQASTCEKSNGSMVVHVNFTGTPPYQYSIDGGLTYSAPTASLSFNFDNLMGGPVNGIYNVYVLDASGGPAHFATATIGDIAGPTLMLSPQAASCANNDGDDDWWHPDLYVFTR
jgi:hypothetical protein